MDIGSFYAQTIRAFGESAQYRYKPLCPTKEERKNAIGTFPLGILVVCRHDRFVFNVNHDRTPWLFNIKIIMRHMNHSIYCKMHPTLIYFYLFHIITHFIFPKSKLSFICFDTSLRDSGLWRRKNW